MTELTPKFKRTKIDFETNEMSFHFTDLIDVSEINLDEVKAEFPNDPTVEFYLGKIVEPIRYTFPIKYTADKTYDKAAMQEIIMAGLYEAKNNAIQAFEDLQNFLIAAELDKEREDQIAAGEDDVEQFLDPTDPTKEGDLTDLDPPPEEPEAVEPKPKPEEPEEIVAPILQAAPKAPKRRRKKSSDE